MGEGLPSHWRQVLSEDWLGKRSVFFVRCDGRRTTWAIDIYTYVDRYDPLLECLCPDNVVLAREIKMALDE